MTPESCARMRTTSLWGVAAKWPARVPKMKLILGPRDPQEYSRISLSLSGMFWKSTRTSCQQQNCQNWQHGLVSKPFSSPQMIMYRSAFLVRCVDWSVSFDRINVFLVFFFTLPLDQTWPIHDRSSVKLNFTFFCVPRYKLLLLYITSKVVINVTKSSASDDLLHVNCNATNRTQTCFRSTQVVDCLPDVWVLVLYWRPFYFFVVIVESLLRIFVYRPFYFRCSAVCFDAFCTEGNATGFDFRFDMRYSTKSAKSHSAKCSLHKRAWWGAASKSALSLYWNAQIWSIFATQRVASILRECIVMLWVACELLQFTATQ